MPTRLYSSYFIFHVMLSKTAYNTTRIIGIYKKNMAEKNIGFP